MCIIIPSQKHTFNPQEGFRLLFKGICGIVINTNIGGSSMKYKCFKNTLFLVVLIALAVLTGCGGRNKEALDNELAYRQLGINKMDEGEYEEAVKMFQKALDQSLAVIDELEIDICYYKAAAQYKAGDVDGALATYTALINYDKNNVDALYLRGTLYLTQNDPEQAIKDYGAALEKAGNNGALYNEIAENLMNAGYHDEADAILNQALEVKGEEAEDYREKGRTYCLLEQYDSARTYLDKAINLGDTEAVFYLAKMLEAQGDTEQAGKLYESYIGENSSDTETLNALGCTKLKEGNYEQALVFFQTALQNENPANEQELRRNEIAALEYMLDFAGAKEKMKSYVKDYPEDEAAAREYEFLQSR